MRTVIALTGAMLVASSAHGAPARDHHDECRDWYWFAERIMQGRQVGYPLPDMLAHVEGKSGQPYLDMVIEWAYAEPRYETRDFRLDAVRDFANEVMLDCLRAKRAWSRTP